MTPLHKKAVIMPSAPNSTTQRDIKTVGFFSELKTCDSVEESLKSFDELEDRRKGNKREWR
jgi:hypothetical protein